MAYNSTEYDSLKGVKEQCNWETRLLHIYDADIHWGEVVATVQKYLLCWSLDRNTSTEKHFLWLIANDNAQFISSDDFAVPFYSLVCFCITKYE